MSSIEIGNPQNYIYALIPVFCAVILLMSLLKKRRILDAMRIGIRTRFKITRLVLMVSGICLMFAALLGPQKLEGFTEIRTQGLDIYLLIDTSNSMRVQDVQPDRIGRAKRIADILMNNLKGDRIGLIPFSSEAYVQMPLTDDYDMARMFLDVVDTKMVGNGGTDFGPAVRLAYESFDEARGADKVMIILSDGEDRNSSEPDVLEQINDSRLRVYTIGIGTEEGGKIPIYSIDEVTVLGYIYDDEYNDIISKLQTSGLKKLAADSGGKYYESTASGIEINALIDDMATLKRDSQNVKRINNYTQLYQYFLGFGLLLFLAGYFLPETGRVK
ncbi:MAG: VWA domain-containing protein [Clostridiaceae bacterium]|nr:VWA domain-containing protein [Clostridiaceae bacterium]